MDVRPATAGDLSRVLALGRKFHAAAKPDIAFDAESFIRTALRLIEDDEGALFVAEHDGIVSGMIGGLHYAVWFNSAVSLAQEVFWWVEPWARGDGPEMLTAFEDWARERGASHVDVLALESLRPAAMAALYRRAGYAAREHLFSKRL
jgi:GNAT superfamily N-acetyltransferase